METDKEKMFFAAEVDEDTAHKFDTLAEQAHRSRKKQLEFLITEFVKVNSNPDPDG